MSVKASVSISDQQDSFARRLVEEGRYASLSAVVQRGLELLRQETELKDAEIAALRDLLAERGQGEFISVEDGKDRTAAMIAAKKAGYGL
ncbi:type II toxin-antitoxin system ParD family antitoxin [Agrobacterium sp. O3.4]|uniref:Type II toxin-antitoxin system ParD family antitoxin n=2 Tax=Rhizobium/Agrobacterium group TaxID=227290 RepID=A0AA88F6W2_RHIRH|nr:MULTISPECIES: type II toxin-antitoxin system ParD family antitoxin [Rhizobium/Agrobacterium group]KAA3503175.1 type II toxin-antitoxin system ParD family antitoxin [Rhizobium rhizogenes]MCZ7468011.1 type II toxin-antitoxin system ParD family antitoxin [Rhizobium rhizogenes]MDA5632314.1 type II toxin-antitoxin system ParD family antitoxin [Agrobacterium sp. ST15.16.024]MDF1888177.1 type II toxin-antitoxin system ParD family antitoxin [Rhizobium rhizogenes]WHO08839.1 type II toxin-antitoxin s